MEKLSLATLKNGAAIELVDDAIQRLLENIIDPNTKAAAKRAVTLTLSWKPDESREMASVGISVKSSLAPAKGCTATAFIALTRNGVMAAEHDPRQGGLFEEEKPEPLKVVEGGGGESTD